MTDPLVVFTPSGKRGRFALGTPVLTAARQRAVTSRGAGPVPAPRRIRGMRD